MDRSDLVRQLVRRLNGAISDEELARWAAEAILDNENPIPSNPIEEHDLVQEVLDECALASIPQFGLGPDDVRELLMRLVPAPSDDG